MKHTLFGPLAALSLALAACSGGGDPLADARAQLAAQDLAGARASLLEVVKRDPRDAASLRLLLATQLQLADGDGAQVTIGRLRGLGQNGDDLTTAEAEAVLLRGHPDRALELLGDLATPAAWRIRAAARLDQDDAAGALAAFRQGIAAGTDFMLVRDYGWFLVSANDIDGARAQLATMRTIKPDDLATALLAGEIAQRQGNADEAVTTYERAAAAFPRRIEPLLGIAAVEDGRSRGKQAAAALARASAIAPGDRRVIDMKVQLAAVAGDWKQVVAVLQPVEGSLDPASTGALTYAEALLNLGRPEQARAMFTQALALSPNNPHARLMLARAQLDTGDARTALETVRPLAASPLADPRALWLAATAAQQAASAEAGGFKARLDSATSRAQAEHGKQAQAAMARRDWAGALAIYRQMPGGADDPEVLKRMAVAQSNLGNHAEAVALADKARTLRPGDVDLTYLAGSTRQKGGIDPATAQALLREAAETAPRNLQFQQAWEQAKAAAR